MLKNLVHTIVAICLLAGCAMLAQPLYASNETGNDVARLIASRANAEVDAGGGLNLGEDLPARVDITGPESRLSAISIMASDLGARWSKVYVISPATSAADVTTYAEAQRFVDNEGVLSTNISDIPAVSLIRIVAAADSATIKLTPGIDVHAPIALNVPHARVAWAIAQIAKDTHTHWTAHYVLTPDPDLQSVANNGGVKLSERPGTPNGPIVEHVLLHNGKDETAETPATPGLSSGATTARQNPSMNSLQPPYTSGNGYGYTYPNSSGFGGYPFNNRVETIPGNNGLLIVP